MVPRALYRLPIVLREGFGVLSRGTTPIVVSASGRSSSAIVVDTRTQGFRS